MSSVAVTDLRIFFAGTPFEHSFEVLVPPGFSAHIERVEDRRSRCLLIFTAQDKKISAGVVITAEPQNTYLVSQISGWKDPAPIYFDGESVKEAQIMHGISLLAWRGESVQGVNVY